MTVNMGTVWDRTTEFLSDNLSSLAPIVLAALIVPQAISDAFGGAGGQAGSAVAPGAAQGAGLLSALIGLWGQLAIVALALDPDAGPASARAAATRGYGRAVLAMILVFVVLGILAAPVLIVLAASGVDVGQLSGSGGLATAPDISPGAGAFLGIYGIALLIVVLIVSVRLAPLYPVVIAERKGVSAIGRSLRVTRGITWKLAGVWLLFLVVFLVAAGAARTVFGSIAGLIAPDDGPFNAAAIVTAIVGALITAAFSTLIAAFSAKLYRAVATLQSARA